MFPTMLLLLRQQYARDRDAIDAARTIAQGVIAGTQDRSGDRHLRPLLDLQRRDEPLRRLRRRASKKTAPPRKARRVEAPRLLCGRQEFHADILRPE